MYGGCFDTNTTPVLAKLTYILNLQHSLSSTCLTGLRQDILECQVSMQDFAAAYEFLIKSNVLDQVSEVLTVFTYVNPRILECAHNTFTRA